MSEKELLGISNAPAKFKSGVWKFFGFPKYKDGIDEKSTICRLCNHVLSYTCKNTSNMAVHLKRKHAIVDDNSSSQSTAVSSQESSSGSLLGKRSATSTSTKPNVKGQLSIHQAFVSKLAPESPRAKLITRNLAVYIATDLRPYSIVDSPAFKSLVNSLEPKYTVPSRTTLSKKVIPALYDDVQKEVKASLQEAQTIAMTTDGWTSRATESYVTITAHFIDQNWKLQNRVLQTRPLHESHTGSNIADVITEAVDEWKLKRPHGVQPLTSDSAANMVVAAKEAGTRPHIRCFAHVINLAAQQALKIGDVQRVLGRVKRVVNFFHKSSTASHQFRLKQSLLQLPKHKLLNEVKTRWNSAYDMLERYLEQQPAIMATLMSPEIRKDKDLDTLSATDIATAEDLVRILEPLKTITTVLCDASQPTISMVQPLLANVMRMMKPAVDDSLIVNQVKLAVVKDLEKRYTDEGVRKVMLQSSAIDPRFKALPFLNPTEKLEIQASLITVAESLRKSCMAHTAVIKSEPGLLPAEPALPLVDDTKPAVLAVDHAEAEPQTDTKKTALESLFGDVFVVSHEPAVKSDVEMLEEELRVYKTLDSLSINHAPLPWWEMNQYRFPFLSKVAKHLLCIPATSVPSERVFSTAGDIVTAQRASLLPENVDMLVFLKKNVQT